MSVFGFFLVRIFPHSDWIRRNTENLSVFSPNAGECGPEKLRIRTLFTQCYPVIFSVILSYLLMTRPFFLPLENLKLRQTILTVNTLSSGKWVLILILQNNHKRLSTAKGPLRLVILKYFSIMFQSSKLIFKIMRGLY